MISSKNREIQVFLLHILKTDKNAKEKIGMKTVIVLLMMMVIPLAVWFIVPYYIALFKKDVTKIRTSATFAHLVKAEQEIEKKIDQSAGKDVESANNTAGKI